MTGKTCLKCWVYFMPGTCLAPSSSEKHFTRTLFGWGVNNIFSCCISNMIFRVAGVLDAAWVTGFGKESYKHVDYRDKLKNFGTVLQYTYLTFSLGSLFCTNLLSCTFFYWPRSCYLWKSCSWLHAYIHDSLWNPNLTGNWNWTEVQPENSLRKWSIFCLSF